MIDRRKLVGFDPDHFAKTAAADGPPGALSAFRYAYHHNLWRGAETPSGPGSSVAQTRGVVAALPGLCQRYDVRTLLDVPCGSFNWMASVNLPGVRYTGGDIVPELVAEAARRYGTRQRRFLVLDLTRSPLPPADLLLCRDCLVHLSFRDIATALANIRSSNIEYVLTTTFTAESGFGDIVTGDWRPINLQIPPFSFPTPVELFWEQCTEQHGAFADKALGLWRVRDLPDLGVSAA
ncbi:MAG: methyltransferase domain-containing protein [Gemmatimonadota bacterium]|nr:methyltransferase domain-containing protein [Gemmatimonadota bacterium]